MRREVSWGLAAAAALVLGAAGAESYARLLLPYYFWVDRVIASGHPWDVTSLEIAVNDSGPGKAVTLTADVYRRAGDANPAARVVARVQVGEAVETPVVFWTLVLLWPAGSGRQRWVRLGFGIPLLLGVEAITTAVQLIHTLPEASALLAGENQPFTPWERWSRFLEAGGQFVVIVFAALLTIALARRAAGPAAALDSAAQPVSPACL